MIEQSNTTDADRYIHASEVEDNKNTIKLNRKGKLVLVGTGAILASGIIAGGANILHETPIGTDIESVPQGGNAIDTIRTSVNEIAEEHGFDPNTVHGVVEEGNKIGSHVAAWEQLESTVSVNGLGQPSVETKRVDPANLAHLDD